jgi:hypothetical protein
MHNASNYLQRLLAGCPVDAPTRAAYPEFGDALAALYETHQQNGLKTVYRAWEALCNAEPAPYATCSLRQTISITLK